MPGTLRLSAKEVSGLASRVFVSAFLPSGATGAASEAVEFLELTGANALARLDREKEELLSAPWQGPSIIEEGDCYAVCDAGRSPAPFYCAVLADWLAAMVSEKGGSAAIAVRGGLLHHYLGAVPYFLASRGLSGITLELMEDGARVSAAVTAGLSWRYIRIPPQPLVLPMPGGFPSDMAKDARALLFAFGKGRIDFNPFALAAEGKFEITADDYAALKTRILAEGWQIDADLWARLMHFADRSLIKTSERSRLGAG